MYGYLGVGNYKAKIDGKQTIQYQYWSNMFKRCYDEKYHKQHPTYKDCEVCKSWFDFQVFAKWFDENYYEIENQRMDLDKDILYKNNKIYSPDTCVFVPQRINKLFIKNDNVRGDYPIGVTYHKASKKYLSRCNTLEKSVSLGYFNTPEEAFYEGYKPFKEAYIKEIAEYYKDIIPKELYHAMYIYEVNIVD